VLFDNPKTVTLTEVAGAAVLNPDMVRLASHYRFRPQTAMAGDPESKGKVEAVVRFGKSDLIPYEGFGSLDEANEAARVWCQEVNAQPHSETKRSPVELLEVERPLLRSLPSSRPAVACGEERKVDRLATIRFCSARYSVPHRLVGKTVNVTATDREVMVLFEGVPVAHHALLAAGECSVIDAHYPTPPPDGARPLRPRTDTERAFLALGDEAEEYLRAAAARGTSRLGERIDEALTLAATRGEHTARAVLARATRFARFGFGDLESIADAIAATPPERSLDAAPLQGLGLPAVPSRPIEAYRREEHAA